MNSTGRYAPGALVFQPGVQRDIESAINALPRERATARAVLNFLRWRVCTPDGFTDGLTQSFIAECLEYKTHAGVSRALAALAEIGAITAMRQDRRVKTRTRYQIAGVFWHRSPCSQDLVTRGNNCYSGEQHMIDDEESALTQTEIKILKSLIAALPHQRESDNVLAGNNCELGEQFSLNDVSIAYSDDLSALRAGPGAARRRQWLQEFGVRSPSVIEELIAMPDVGLLAALIEAARVDGDSEHRAGRLVTRLRAGMGADPEYLAQARAVLDAGPVDLGAVIAGDDRAAFFAGYDEDIVR